MAIIIERNDDGTPIVKNANSHSLYRELMCTIFIDEADLVNQVKFEHSSDFVFELNAFMSRVEKNLARNRLFKNPEHPFIDLVKKEFMRAFKKLKHQNGGIFNSAIDAIKKNKNPAAALANTLKLTNDKDKEHQKELKRALDIIEGKTPTEPQLPSNRKKTDIKPVGK